MTNENTKVWKEADNRVEVVGLLVENNLELRQFDVYKNGQKTGDKRDAIAGDVTIRSADNEDHKIRLRQYKFTNAGAANKLYQGLVTIMNETISLADLEQEANKDKTVTRLKVVGDLGLNEFADQASLEIRSFPSIRGTFLNRIEESDTTTEDKAEFDLVGLVKSVVEEQNREGEETGRMKVSLLLPLYNSVVPMEFVVDAGKGAEYVQSNFEKGETVRVYGDLVNFREVTYIEVEMDFGGNKRDEKVKFVNELNIKGGSVMPEDSAASISVEAVKEKLAEREVYLETLKTRAKERGQENAGGGVKSKSGFGGEAETKKTALDTPSSLSADDLKDLF